MENELMKEKNYSQEDLNNAVIQALIDMSKVLEKFRDKIVEQKKELQYTKEALTLACKELTDFNEAGADYFYWQYECEFIDEAKQKLQKEGKV